MSAYKEAFFASAKDAAAAGTLTDVGTLGEIITIADKLGMNPKNIDGVNYVEMLKNADPANYGASPYNYLYAAEAASAHGLTDAADAFCGKMIGFYTIGTGTDFGAATAHRQTILQRSLLPLNTAAEIIRNTQTMLLLCLKTHTAQMAMLTTHRAQIQRRLHLRLIRHTATKQRPMMFTNCL